MRLPDQILNTVCFIAHSTEEIKYGGTAFVVSIKGANDNAFLYLVTAKHVAEAIEDCPFIIGLNEKNGGKALIDADGVKWYYHPTEPNAVDAAVTPFSPKQYEQLNVQWIHAGDDAGDNGMFALPAIRQEAGIGIGDEIAVVGLFTRFWGRKQLFPIARIGNLAMLPTERIPVNGFEPMEVFLAEGRSIGGLSGSPVFVRQTMNILVEGDKGEPIPFAGVGQIYFLGLMHGHWRVARQTMKAEGVEVSEAVNMGVSIVVPAHKIREILDQPELLAMRKKIDAEIASERGPVPDSELQKPGHVFTKLDFEAALKMASRKITPTNKK